MKARVIELLHHWLGLFPSRVKDPYCAIVGAQIYLIREYSTAAMMERGCYLPEQLEAIALLEQVRKQIPLETRRWLIE